MATDTILKPVEVKEYLSRVLGGPVTHRYRLTNGRLEPDGSTTNTGISSYICEAICKGKWMDMGAASAEEWATELVTAISAEAIQYKGFALWCWEKKPSRPDYKYPPDWDDVCKSVDAIRAYQDRYGGDTDVTLPPSRYIEENLRNLVFESDHVGEEVRYRCQNRRALYMFMVGCDVKKNNTEDIMVSAVALRCLLRQYPDVLDRNREVIGQLLARLVETAKWGLVEDVPFSCISRCYFSWGHFLLVLSDIAGVLPTVHPEVRLLSARYLNDRLYERLLPKNLGHYLGRDEVAYSALLADNLELDLPGDLRQRTEWMGEDDFQIVYRHRRLDHYYGSPAWSAVLRLLSMRALAG